MKKVLILGAGAVGRACVAQFADAGAEIAVADIAADAIEAADRVAKGRMVASASVDVCASSATEELRTLVTNLGGVDLAVFSAGLVWYGDPLTEVGPDFSTLLRVSVVGFKRFATAVSPSLIERRGMMIVVSGSDARLPQRLFELWAVTSACVQAAAKCFHDAVANRGVRVVNLAIDGVTGGGLDAAMAGLAEMTGQDLDVLERFVAARRPHVPPTASDVAELTARIADAPLFGATIALDGGATGRCWP